MPNRPLMNFVSTVSSSSSSAARTCDDNGPDKTMAMENTATQDSTARRQALAPEPDLTVKPSIEYRTTYSPHGAGMPSARSRKCPQIRALLRRGHPVEFHTTNPPPQQRWPHRQG